MSDLPAREPGTFVMPAFWNDAAFTAREMAEFNSAPTVTVESWLNTSRIAGRPMGTMRGGRRFFDCHEVYLVTLLGKLRSARIPVSDALIKAAHDFAHVAGKPRAPVYGETWDIRGDATIQVPAWLCWIEVRAMAMSQFGPAHDASDAA